MGAVYEGFHDAVERQVAIKVLRPDFANKPDFVTRFFNEICITFFRLEVIARRA